TSIYIASPTLSSIAPPATQISTLSLHDALPISVPRPRRTPGRPDRALLAAAVPGPERDVAWHAAGRAQRRAASRRARPGPASPIDRKSTRLNSSHLGISYAVFCLKKKNKKSTIY